MCVTHLAVGGAYGIPVLCGCRSQPAWFEFSPPQPPVFCLLSGGGQERPRKLEFHTLSNIHCNQHHQLQEAGAPGGHACFTQ
jgi:hypothetical protein